MTEDLGGSGCGLTEEMSWYFLAVAEENYESLSHESQCSGKEIRNGHSRIQLQSDTLKLSRDP
jgi:hypothetical protein